APCVSGFDMIPPPPLTPQPLRETGGAKTRSDPRPNGYRKRAGYGVFVVVLLLVVVFAGDLRSTNVAISAATLVLSVVACSAVSFWSATALSIRVFAAAVSAWTRPSRVLPLSFAISPRLFPLRIAAVTSYSETPPR